MAVQIVSLRIEGDSSNAKAALASAEVELKKLGFSMSVGKRTVEQWGDATEKAMKGSAGSVANLVSQFNDIGVMMAAGQNPLQLALQQGTQVAQVIGPLGAAGAFKALGGAVLGMLNPVSLATIGVIGFGSAAVQWLTSASDEGEALAKTFDGLESAMTALNAAQKDAGRSVADLVAQYGAGADAAAELYDRQRQIAYLNALGAASSASGGLTDAFGSVRFLVDDLQVAAEAMSGVGRTAAEIAAAAEAVNGINPDAVTKLAKQFDITKEAAQLLAEQIAAVDTARGPEAQALAWQNVREQLELAIGNLGSMSEATRPLYEQIVAAELKYRELANMDAASGIVKASEAAAALTANLGLSVDMAARFAAQRNAIAQSYGPSAIIVGPEGEPVLRGTYQEGGMDAAARGAEAPQSFRQARHVHCIQGGRWRRRWWRSEAGSRCGGRADRKASG